MRARGYRVIINTAFCVNRFKPKFQKAQEFVDSEVLKDCDPYVPMRSGNLVRSGQRGTSIGSGQVVYNAPHAGPQYHAYPNKSKSKHPQATMEWFEAAKAVNKEKWIKGAQRIVTGK